MQYTTIASDALNHAATELHKEVSRVILNHALQQKPMRVYREAETIRSRLDLNIALEDVVDAFLHSDGSMGVVFEIDPADAADSVLGFKAANGIPFLQRR